MQEGIPIAIGRGQGGGGSFADISPPKMCDVISPRWLCCGGEDAHWKLGPGTFTGIFGGANHANRDDRGENSHWLGGYQCSLFRADYRLAAGAQAGGHMAA